jgi:hypothetical protein
MSGTRGKEMRGLKIGLTDYVPRQGKHLAEPTIERLRDISRQLQMLLLIFSYRDDRRPEKYKRQKERETLVLDEFDSCTVDLLVEHDIGRL